MTYKIEELIDNPNTDRLLADVMNCKSGMFEELGDLILILANIGLGFLILAEIIFPKTVFKIFELIANIF